MAVSPSLRARGRSLPSSLFARPLRGSGLMAGLSRHLTRSSSEDHPIGRFAYLFQGLYHPTQEAVEVRRFIIVVTQTNHHRIQRREDEHALVLKSPEHE